MKRDALNGQTALLRLREMAEADRLTVAAGTPAIDMMESAGSAVSREIERRWPRVLLSCCVDQATTA